MFVGGNTKATKTIVGASYSFLKGVVTGLTNADSPVSDPGWGFLGMVGLMR